MGSTNHQRWARIPPENAWKFPGIPTHWVRVLSQHPNPDVGTLPGYVWVDSPAKLLHVRAAWLEEGSPE